MEQLINNRVQWVESLRIGENSTGRFPSGKAMKSFSSQLWDWNKITGIQKGVFVHAAYDYKNLTVTIVAITVEQRELELTNPATKNDWRKLLPGHEEESE